MRSYSACVILTDEVRTQSSYREVSGGGLKNPFDDVILVHFRTLEEREEG